MQLERATIMEENVEQIINTEESLDSEEVSEEQVTESNNEETETESTNNNTKRMSDRINEIRRQEAEKRSELERELNELRSYKQSNEWQKAADERGISLDEYRTQMQAEEAEKRSIVENDPRYQELEEKVFLQQVAEDLKSLQEAFPEDNIKDIRSLDEKFGVLRDAGIDAVTAYKAIRQETPSMPTTGSSQTKTSDGKGELTMADLEGMTARQVADNYDEVMRLIKNNS